MAVPGCARAIGITNRKVFLRYATALQTENARLRESAAASKSAASSYVHPPNFYPPPQAAYPGNYSNYYGAPYADPYGAPQGYGGYGQAPQPSSWNKLGGPQQHQMGQRPGQLAMNSQNQRGPKGANLAIFCIPNAYTDQHVYELAKQFGAPIFCSVVTHRDTGMSRGYAFVSYNTLEEANSAISGLHNMSVEGRSLRCEVARQDRDGGGNRPY